MEERFHGDYSRASGTRGRRPTTAFVRRTLRIQFGIRLGWLLLGLGLSLCGAEVRAAAQQPYTIDVAAPELVGGSWLNTAKNAPITLASRKGKVTIVEFWTFG